jgi:hypothetical protein
MPDFYLSNKDDIWKNKNSANREDVGEETLKFLSDQHNSWCPFFFIFLLTEAGVAV